VNAVWDAIERHLAFLETDDRLSLGRRRRLALEVASLATERLRVDVHQALESDAALHEDLAERRVDPYRAASILLERVGAPAAGR
jgi:putative protein kinase ArgK-like GTPase of G3E family